MSNKQVSKQAASPEWVAVFAKAKEMAEKVRADAERFRQDEAKRKESQHEQLMREVLEIKRKLIAMYGDADTQST